MAFVGINDVPLSQRSIISRTTTVTSDSEDSEDDELPENPLSNAIKRPEHNEPEDIRDKEYEIRSIDDRRGEPGQYEYLCTWAESLELEQNLRRWPDGSEYIRCDGTDYFVAGSRAADPEPSTGRAQRWTRWRDPSWRPRDELMGNASSLVEDYDAEQDIREALNIGTRQGILDRTVAAPAHRGPGGEPQPVLQFRTEQIQEARDRIVRVMNTSAYRDLAKTAARRLLLSLPDRPHIDLTKNLAYRGDLGVHRVPHADDGRQRAPRGEREALDDEEDEDRHVVGNDSHLDEPSSSARSSTPAAAMDQSSVVDGDESSPITNPSSPFVPLTPASNRRYPRMLSPELGNHAGTGERFKDAAPSFAQYQHVLTDDVGAGPSLSAESPVLPSSPIAAMAFGEFQSRLPASPSPHERSLHLTIDATGSEQEVTADQEWTPSHVGNKNVPTPTGPLDREMIISGQRDAGLPSRDKTPQRTDGRAQSSAPKLETADPPSVKRRILSPLTSSQLNVGRKHTPAGSSRLVKTEPGSTPSADESESHARKRALSSASTPDKKKQLASPPPTFDMIKPDYVVAIHPRCIVSTESGCKDKTMGYASALAAHDSDQEFEPVYRHQRFARLEASEAQVRFILAKCPCNETQWFHDEWTRWLADREEDGKDPGTKEKCLSRVRYEQLNWVVAKYCPEQIDLTLD